jgi:hypothetical protein
VRGHPHAWGIVLRDHFISTIFATSICEARFRAGRGSLRALATRLDLVSREEEPIQEEEDCCSVQCHKEEHEKGRGCPNAAPHDV